MMKNRNGIVVYERNNDGWQCYRKDCTSTATGIWKSHGGAHWRACAQHEGECHEACWEEESWRWRLHQGAERA